MKKLFILLLFFSSVNAQKIRISTSIGGNYSDGNTGLFLGSLQGNIRTDSSNKEWGISPYFCYSQVRSNGEWNTKQRESYITGAYTLRKSDWSLYLFSDAENSLQKKFNFKGSLGIGVGTRLINNGDIYLGGSLALMPEYYVSSDNIYEKTLRLSARIRFSARGKFRVSSITLIQPPIIMYPKLPFGDNISIRSSNSISYPIIKNLDIGFRVLINTFTLTNYLTPNLKSTDVTSSFTLTYTR